MGGMLYVEMVMQILESEKVSKVRQSEANNNEDVK
jgi:hypothetical protein